MSPLPEGRGVELRAGLCAALARHNAGAERALEACAVAAAEAEVRGQARLCVCVCVCVCAWMCV